MNKSKPIAEPKTVGDHIRNARVKANYSIQELSRLSGVSDMTIFKWEHDAISPNVYSAILVADVLGISIDTLVGHNT